MRGKFYRSMGSEHTPMFTIAVFVRASLDIDVLRHLCHHWRLYRCIHCRFHHPLVHGKVLTIRNSK